MPTREGVTLASEAEHTIRVSKPFTKTRRLARHASDPIGPGRAHEGGYMGASIDAGLFCRVIKKHRGIRMLNPFLAVIDNLESRQHAVIRNISLNQPSNDIRTIKGSAKNET